MAYSIITYATTEGGGGSSSDGVGGCLLLLGGMRHHACHKNGTAKNTTEIYQGETRKCVCDSDTTTDNPLDTSDDCTESVARGVV